MSEPAQSFHLVDTEDLFEYPIPAGERLNSHFFMMWHFDWWLNSDFKLLADKEVRAVGFDLFNVAQKQDPVGTLPEDDRLLAKLVGETMEEWQRLKERPINPLYQWERCICTDGRIRRYHPVVLKIAQEALGLRTERLEKRADDRDRKRLAALPEKMVRAGASKAMAEDEVLVLRFDQFMVDHFDKLGQRRPPLVRKALDAFSLHSEGLDWRAETAP